MFSAHLDVEARINKYHRFFSFFYSILTRSMFSADPTWSKPPQGVANPFHPLLQVSRGDAQFPEIEISQCWNLHNIEISRDWNLTIFEPHNIEISTILKWNLLRLKSPQYWNLTTLKYREIKISAICCHFQLSHLSGLLGDLSHASENPAI